MKSRFPAVSVVILNYNGLEFAEECVKSVLANSYPKIEILIVDNASTDGSFEAIVQRFGRIRNVKIIHNSRNLGFAEGNNVGFKNTSGEIVVFLNVDTRVERKWLWELVRALCSDNKVGGVQSKLMSMKDPKQLDSAGFYIDRLGYVFPRAKRFAGLDPDEGAELFYVEGTSMAFWKLAVNEAALNGDVFDRDYGLYFEDTDLSWRVRLRGYSLRYVPSSVVYHYRGASAAQRSRHARAFSFTKNQIMTLAKNYNLGNLLRYILVVYLLEAANSVLLLHSEKLKSVAKLKALLWCLTNLREIRKKRVFVQERVRIVPDSELLKHMLQPNLLALRAGISTLY